MTCHGRRRIGKSRFIQQCAKQANAFFEFSGLPPRPGLTKKEQLTAFSEQLSKQSKAPKLPLDNWSTAFQLLASQHTVLYAGPYRQSKTQRKQGCQIDLLIQTKRSVYLCEIKFKSQISTSVIQEVDRKIGAIKLPKNQSIRTVLIYDGQLAPSIEEDQAFDFLIPASELFVI